ncbi:MAG: 30S ribosome-binding factor RbfA [Anaerolineales bacterium]|nr:MAG: 30S ribosome-binding factor RbfA [Anaerolineales bacterium]
MVSITRAQRIATRIREELSEMLILEISDPRLNGVSITDVRVDRELAYADIYFSAIQGSEISQSILEGFEHAQGFIRRELMHRVDLRSFPRLRFHWDPTFDRAERIDRLIAELNEQANTSDNQEETDEG